MKSFSDILTESKKTYSFLIKIAGDLPEGCEATMKTALERFSLQSCSACKKTPIQESPLDFPSLKNMEVHTWECDVNYPTTREVLENYLASCCNIPAAHIVVRVPGEPLELQQQPKNEEPYESMLNTEDMGGESAQESAGTNRVMDLLKELEVARKEREIDPVAGMTAGESKDIGETENTTSVVGS
jgi:hypothetical protein